MKIETELMRGAGPVAVLKVLERREMYGYELVEALAEKSGGVLSMGQSTLYPLLHNLEAKGLVASRWLEGEGRQRKYYKLTDKGRKRLTAAAKEWRDVTQAMHAIGVLAGIASLPTFRSLTAEGA